jgi:ribonuclease-3 family protein
LKDFLRPEPDNKLREMPVLSLAYVGDAVFELMVRTELTTGGEASTVKKLHDRAVELVSAKAQALVVERLLPHLDEEETAIYKRGRNAHVNSVPKGSTATEYHAATGMEALFGYLYLSGKLERLNELFTLGIKE